MYSESIGSRKSLGDVDVLYHDGLYHLFHLVLPNHDFIAHAISEDGLTWQRVDNAIFIGHPGSWDDSMLWTMHVTRDPYHPERWRMFYTGLSRHDRGLSQRIGLAFSDNLYQWWKAPVSWKDHRRTVVSEFPTACLRNSNYDANSDFPLSPDPEHYESTTEEGRHWVSWRDPYYFRDGERGWLLTAGRVKDGPITRRGCVALTEEVGENKFEGRPPLHFPGLYDDVEVPCLFKLDGEYFLIGSLREDAKIRYWHANFIDSPWRSYHDNVLLAAGNYAGRICQDDQGILIWNFFSQTVYDRVSQNLMPPPKRLIRSPNGLLRAQSFERIRQRACGDVDPSRINQLGGSQYRQDRDGVECHWEDGQLRLRSDSGFQAFVFAEEFTSFRLAATLQLSGLGKCGFVFRLDEATHDGYYVSLDLLKGIAQVRDWGTGPEASGEHMMSFETLQTGNWFNEKPGHAAVELMAFGSYFELSIDGRVVLSLANQHYIRGSVGFYTETATIYVRDIELQHLQPPTQSDEHLSQG